MKNSLDNYPDQILVVDTFLQRGKVIADFLRQQKLVKKVDLVAADRRSPDVYRAEVGIKVAKVLDEQQNLMTIMNYYAGIEGGVFRMVRELESKYGLGSRRIFVSCQSASLIKRALGEERSLVKCVPYNMDRDYHLETIRGLL